MVEGFHPVVKAWFEETFGKPSPPQAQGWPVIARGENALILAPTGSGKTLAAFLKCLDQLYHDCEEQPSGVQVLYISPLKALNNDVYRNLEVPLRGIEAKAAAMGMALPRLKTAVRTGDTPPRERAAMVRRPPHVLITTPESLYLMLTSKARSIFRTVRYIIVDEIHAMCGTKRGVHLSVSLERLEALISRPPVRIGLSATQRPLEEIARYLGGVGRSVEIIDTGTRKQLDLKVEVPLEDMRALPENSMWAAIYPRLLELISQHQSTLIFVNGRGLAERLTGRLNDHAGYELVKCHHGSVSKEVRAKVEADLKEGRLPCLVATSSLELGIDIGAIDLVVQIESPKSVARGLQRVGRAGHVIGAASKGRLIPKWRGDLLETACIVREMKLGQVEETRVPTGALDVLAQQITAMAAVDDWKVDDLLALLRRSYCYRDLSERQLNSVLEMLSGRYPSEEFRELRPRIVWDREENLIQGREGAKHTAIRSGGTIPDRGYYGVYIRGTTVKLGELDEEMVYESRVGDTFQLGTASWKIETIEHDRVTVSEAFGTIPRAPFWKGDGLGRPYEMGRQLGAFIREVGGRLDDPHLLRWLEEECCLDERAAWNLRQYLVDQVEATGALPHDRQISVEYYFDELGDRRVVIHSPFGGRVNLAWSMVMKRRLRDLLGIEAEMFHSDDGIHIRLPGADAPPPIERMLQADPAEAEEMLLQEVGNTAVFGAYFRMNAGRALVLPRPQPGRRQPFWLQRLRAADLLQVARRYDSFPVVLETYREVLRDVLDMEGLRQVLSGLTAGEIDVRVMETDAPSPFAAAFLMNLVGAYMYEGETPRAERRSALLQMNRDLLKEVLGSESLRDLLDPRAINAVGARLQRLEPEWHPRNANETDDMLRRLGDLSWRELETRGVQFEWLTELKGRVKQVAVAGEPRWISADDLGMYGDLTGHAGAVIRRYARNHGPFVTEDLVQRYGYDRETVLRYLDVLRAEGILAAGEYTRGVTSREFCDTEVLQQVHRQTLSLLRREVEPVDGAAFARFLLDWQGLGAKGAGAKTSGVPHALRKALAHLQGVPLPAEAWERDVLPARVPGYQPLWLDQMLAMGELHWAGMAGGKLAFYLPETLHAFSARFGGAAAEPLTPEQRKVLAVLEASGADFLGGVARGAGLGPSQALDTLWELAWLGQVTNDTFAPVRQVMRAGKAAAQRGRPVGLQGGTGRWSLTARLLRAPGAGAQGGPPASPAEAYTRILLDRYGVVTREAVQSEDGPLTWSEVLATLKHMEMRGLVRQGYFIRDLSGAQFALPEAVEKLRAARDGGGDAPAPGPTTRLVAACDPGNPYGSILPGAGRGTRSYLVLEDGRPVLAIEASGKRISPLTPDLPQDRLFAALGSVKSLLAGPGAPRRIDVESWGDTPIQDAPAAALLQQIGFERTPKGLVLYK
ncbi:MAG: ATP-dependent helicase [Symbiobacteriaceae bacterium]|nr:ATP-dependent helicase [Symbiobacteriaceae bacterium]